MGKHTLFARIEDGEFVGSCDCGCELRANDDGTVDFLMCSKHMAAPDMLNQLEDIECESAWNDSSCIHTLRTKLNNIADFAQAAIDKARAKD